MSERPKYLQDLIDSLQAELLAGKSSDASRPCLARVFDALATPRSFADRAPARLPVLHHLDGALDTARKANASLARIADAFAALDPYLTWARRAQGDHTSSENFIDGHANVTIVGPMGHEPRDDVWVGASLLAPHVRYPDHHHAPEEVYLALSRGKFQHGEDEWFEPGIGGIFHNIPNIKHAMASVATPFFAIWCLSPVK